MLITEMRSRLELKVNWFTLQTLSFVTYRCRLHNVSWSRRGVGHWSGCLCSTAVFCTHWYLKAKVYPGPSPLQWQEITVESYSNEHYQALKG